MKRPRRKARSAWIDIIFSVAILSLTAFAVFLFMKPTDHQSNASGKKEEHRPVPVIVDQIASNYPGIKIIIETSNDKRTPFAIQYPQSIHSEFNEEVTKYITDIREQYINDSEKKTAKNDDVTGELNIAFETLLHHSGNYSFVLFNSSSFSDDQNGVMEIRSFHLNPETGERFTIADLFAHDLEKLSALSTLLREAIYEDESLKNHLLIDEIHLRTEPSWRNFNNFALTDEALLFYFDPATIAEESVGPAIINIPLDRLKGIISDEYQLPEHQPQNQDTDASNPIDHNGKEGKQSEKVERDDEKVSDDQDSTKDAETPIENVEKKVALTFDDGPDPKVTKQILEVLARHDAKATFFMLGSRVEYYPELAKAVMEAGHELGNHTWNHPDLTKLNADRVRKEIANTSKIIEEVTGEQAKSFRPPYGAVNQSVRAQTDLPVTLWDVDTLDWKHRNANKLLEIVKGNVKDGSTILMHDIHQSTADGLEDVLNYLEAEGYTFVTVSELD